MVWYFGILQISTVQTGWMKLKQFPENLQGLCALFCSDQVLLRHWGGIQTFTVSMACIWHWLYIWIDFIGRIIGMIVILCPDQPHVWLRCELWSPEIETARLGWIPRIIGGLYASWSPSAPTTCFKSLHVEKGVSLPRQGLLEGRLVQVFLILAMKL